MANILKVNEQNSIQQLAAQGWSRRRIARELNLDRKTVRRYLEAAAKSPTISTPGSPEPPESKSPISPPGEESSVDLCTAVLEVEAGRPSLCDPHRACIDSKLDAGLSAQRIYQDLVSEFSFSGSYQSVKRFVRQLRAAQPMGLIDLTQDYSFKTVNDACASALSRGAWRLRDVRALLEQRQREVQAHLSFAQSHPLIRNLAEYGLFIQSKIQ
jgi:winged helix-turn helix protein